MKLNFKHVTYFMLLSFCLTTMLLTSCKEEVGTYASLSESYLSIPAYGGGQYVTIYTDYPSSDLYLSHSGYHWYDVSLSGTSISIEVRENTSNEPREAQIYLYSYSKGSLATLTIYQYGTNNGGNDNLGGGSNDNPSGGGNDNSGSGNDNSGGGTSVQKPSAPTGVSVSNEGNNYIPDVRVRWNSVSNATSYYVYKSSSANGTYNKLTETYSTSYSDYNAPTNGASAYYKVKAVNSAGESAFSDYAQYTAPKNDAVLTPATPTVTVSGTSTITVSWTCATGSNYGTPKSYEVYKRDPNTSQYNLLTTTTSKSYSDRNTHPGVNRYAVVAINDAGKSSMGLGASSEVPLTKPTTFTATKSGSYVKFTWSKVANATGYQIFESSSANGSYYICEDINDGTLTSKEKYYPASSGTTTYFKIRAYWQTSYGGSIVYSDYSTYKSVKF